MAAFLQIYKHRIFCGLWLLSLFTVGVVSLTDQMHDILPHPCDSIKCPPISEITCPADSDIRESLNLPASTAAPSIEDEAANNSTAEVDEELYAQCCLAKKCLCRTCYIPGCSLANQVVVELLPESMDTPGHCCGQYECQLEPNCTDVRDTETYWLTDCQRCKCYSGERICHQSCDEGIKKPTAICNSKTLNTFFEHGESWKDGCYECECVNGEEKCVMPFCRSVNCPTHRQVILKDSCCPICWPKGIAMPNGDEDYEEGNQTNDNDTDDNNDDDDEHEKHHSGALGNNIYDDNDDDEDAKPNTRLSQPTHNYAGNDLANLPIIKLEKDLPKETAQNIATSKTPTNATETTDTATISIESTPCTVDERQNTPMPSTYQVYPEVVEVVRQTHQNHLLYAVIGCLTVVIVLLAVWNVHLRAKQRSYRPVSHIDDNFNKMTSKEMAIKKTNDYA